MNTHIGLLDYGMGNIHSVANSLHYLGYEPEIITDAEAIESYSHLIIPGVGSYAEAMTRFAQKNYLTPVLEHARSGKPLLGICLGMQLLSDSGEEGGRHEGLGLIRGNVQLLNPQDLPVPHVGWNALQFLSDHPMFNGVKKHVDFYFVHSYFFAVETNDNVLANTDYGMPFPAIVGKDNVVGIQFHPEKSQDNGLLLLENFCEWDGQC